MIGKGWELGPEPERQPGGCKGCWYYGYANQCTAPEPKGSRERLCVRIGTIWTLQPVKDES